MEKVKIFFTSQGDDTNLAKSFEAKSENSLELQRDGWQAIPNNSKKYEKQRLCKSQSKNPCGATGIG